MIYKMATRITKVTFSVMGIKPHNFFVLSLPSQNMTVSYLLKV